MLNRKGDSSNVQEVKPTYIVQSIKNQRENNEDSFQVFSLIPASAIGQSLVTVLSVADGMGGHEHGEEVSREALRTVSRALFEQLTVERSLNHMKEVPPLDAPTLSQTLFGVLEETNARVNQIVKANNWVKAGSTIVIAAILDDVAVVANLGDSSLFHYQISKKQLTKVTEDHSVAGLLLGAKMITTEVARYHEGRHSLEYYLGCPKIPPELPIHQVDLASGDLILLCTDGVSSSFSNAQMNQIFTDADGDLKRIADCLVTAAQQAGETDNQTLILWRHHSKAMTSGNTVAQSMDTVVQSSPLHELPENQKLKSQEM